MTMADQNASIFEAYIQYLLEHEKRPVSVFHFAKTVGLKEAEFYDKFSSFVDLEGKLWLKCFEDTMARLENEEVYATYTIREKLLAFYYTLLEVLKEHRSFFRFYFENEHVLEFWPDSLSPFKEAFTAYAATLVEEGKTTGEIANRIFVTDRYADLLWLQAIFVIKYWIKDQSEGFEKTDVAVEKAVNFSMDLMTSNSLDSFIDLTKFLFQKK
jgi:hypothetical protein